MDTAEQRDVLGLVLNIAAELHIHVLVGALKTDADQERRTIVDTLAWLKRRTGQDDPAAAMAAAGVCGFAVCPPTGSDLTQSQIQDGLSAILDLGVPTALYQLPQVTLNEMAPETVAELAGRHANFYLLKDTSGEDRVGTSGLDFGGVVLVRGAEGDYDRWLASGGGPYDGFLLSTANCFAPQLYRMIRRIDDGQADEARTLIEPVCQTVRRVFDLVADLPDGNPFANANKAIDHFLAHGPGAVDATPPRLHAGSTLPADVIRTTAEILTEYRLMPGAGYLDDEFQSP